ncbi:MAG: exo-alpha-sialidase [Clostridia bacterium]|nr:exo-alpha-sialidase [Clostridia bacterium]
MAIQKFTVSRNDAITEAWPDVTMAGSGELVCVYTECEGHLNRTNSRIVVRKSCDRGRTWSDVHPITEYGKSDDYYNNARISNIGGKLIILCDRITGEHENKAETVVYAWISEDNGYTWSVPYKTPARGIVPDKLRMTKRGRVLLAAHKFNPCSGKLEQYLWYSDDKGKSWSERVIVGADPRYNLCEACILETEDETLVAFMRENSFKGYDCMKAISTDGGATWQGVYPAPMQGCHRPTAGYLKNGNVLVTYRYLAGAAPFQNTFAALMDKDCITETDRDKQYANILPLDHDRAQRADTGYTGWVQFDDGEIYVVNYITDDAPLPYIRGYSFYPEDIKF